MGHVSLVSHESLAAVVAAEREVPGVAALVADQLVPVPELLLAEVTAVPVVDWGQIWATACHSCISWPASNNSR